jgi:hypothetical protein
LKTNKQTNHKKRAGGVAQGVGPEFKPQYCKKRKKINYEKCNKIKRLQLHLELNKKIFLVRLGDVHL